MLLNMKKVLVIGSVPPPYHGVTIYNYNLLNSKLKNEFELIHLDISDKRDLSNIGKLDFHNIFFSLKNFVSLINILLKKKPDLVYIPVSQNIAFARDGLFILLSHYFSKSKIIIHLHGGNFLNYYLKTNKTMKFIINRSLKIVDGAIVLGNSLTYIFKKWVKNIIIIPNGIDFYLDLSKKRKKTFINLGYMGNITEERGILSLIYSLKTVYESFKNFKLIIAGEWMSQNRFRIEVEEIIKKLDLENFIEFVGYMGGEDKKEFFLNTDIFICPSINEGQPLVILEAMAARCPIIANKDIGAISETIIDGKTGILVNKTKIKELSSAILKLIKSESIRSEMGKNSYKRFLECYTLDKNIEKLISVFNDMLA